MRGLRRILGDRVSGGVIVVALAYTLLLQGLLGAYARTALAAPDAEGLAAFCYSLGLPDGDPAPLESLAHDCCSLLCKAACAAPAALAGGDLGAAFAAAAPLSPGRGMQAERLSPRALGLLRSARGPPAFSRA